MEKKLYGQEELLQYLKDWDIEYDNNPHEEAFTIEEMLPHVGHLKGLLCKSLFVRNRNNTGFWLVMAEHDTVIDLKAVAKSLAVSRLSLADKNQLFEKLGVRQGAVSPFALLNDSLSEVKLVIDEKIWNGRDDQRIYLPPMVNSANLGVTVADLRWFVDSLDRQPIILALGKNNWLQRFCGRIASAIYSFW